MDGGPRNVPDRDGVVEIGDGRVLGYVEYGPADGRAVLWFHGTPGAARQVPPDAPDLARRLGLRLIGLERPGTGRSTVRRYERIADWATDVDAALDGLGVERCAAVGLSGGGPFVLACAWALRDRVVGAAVLGGVGPTCGPEASPGYTRVLPPIEPLLSLGSAPLGEVFSLVLRPLAGPLGSPAFDAYARFVAPVCDREVLARPGMKESFLHDITEASRRGMRAGVHDLVLFGRPWGFSLTDIETPVRFWHGEADKIVPLGHGLHQAALVPDSELTVVPGGGHFSGYETVDEVFSTLLDLWEPRTDQASA